MKPIFSAFGLFALALLMQQQTLAQQTMTPVPVQDGLAKITSENTAIQFVGLHVVTNPGDDTKPRLGGFENFTGTIGVDSANNTITSMAMEIKIDSLWTQFDKLTRHLKNADFFEIEKFDSASFESTSIEVDQLGKTNVVGNLTLHGVTKEIRFPIEATVNEEGVTLRSEFQINRALFGMDKMSGVDKVVSLTFVVGHPTVVVATGEDNPLKAVEEESNSQPEPMENAVEITLKLPNMT